MGFGDLLGGMGSTLNVNQGFFGVASSLTSGPKRQIDNPNWMFGGGTVGGEYGAFLRDLYKTDPTQTGWYKSVKTSLLDSTDMSAKAAEAELGQQANMTGTFDSGARVASLMDVNRSKMQVVAQGLAQTIQQINQAKLGAAVPFLNARLGAYAEYNQALAGSEGAWDTRYGNNISVLNSIIGAAGGMGASGMGGGGMFTKAMGM